MNRLFIVMCLFLNKGISKYAICSLLAMLCALTPLRSYAEIQVRLQLFSLFTNDVEPFSEEWTFEFDIVEEITTNVYGGTDQETIILTNNGDSNGDFLALRTLKETDQLTIFSKTYPTSESLPRAIRVRQRAWENDRGGRTTFDCCSIWRNDDDDYYEGFLTIYLKELVDGQYYVGARSFMTVIHGSHYNLFITRTDDQNSVK